MTFGDTFYNFLWQFQELLHFNLSTSAINFIDSCITFSSPLRFSFIKFSSKIFYKVMQGSFLHIIMHSIFVLHLHFITFCVTISSTFSDVFPTFLQQFQELLHFNLPTLVTKFINSCITFSSTLGFTFIKFSSKLFYQVMQGSFLHIIMHSILALHLHFINFYVTFYRLLCHNLINF